MAVNPEKRRAVEFYTILLSHLADGAVFVEITATAVDDQEPQLLSQEITAGRLGSLDEALEAIRLGVIRSP